MKFSIFLNQKKKNQSSVVGERQDTFVVNKLGFYLNAPPSFHVSACISGSLLTELVS